MADEPLLSMKDFASRLNISTEHLRRLILDGKVRAVDMTRNNAKRRSYRIHPREYDRVIEALATTPPPPPPPPQPQRHVMSFMPRSKTNV